MYKINKNFKKMFALIGNFKTIKIFEPIDLYILYNEKYQNTLSTLSNSSREQI